MHILSNKCKIKVMKTKHIFKKLFRESSSFVYRLGEKMKDKFLWTHTEMEDAIGYLIYFKNYLKTSKDNNITFEQVFGESGEFFEVKHFKKGFNSNSITFKTIVGQEIKKWVLKIGHRISLVADFGDPSTIDYYNQRKKHIEILKRELKKYKVLKNLLPVPEEIIWAVLSSEGNATGRTLVFQPFIHVIKPEKIKKKLTLEQRHNLTNEFMAFKKLCTVLLKEHSLEPDLLGVGNLEIVQKDNDFHLVLLDSGFVNTETSLPITQTLMHFAVSQTFANLENLIKKVL